MKELTGSNYNQMKSAIMRSAGMETPTRSRLRTIVEWIGMVAMLCGLAMLTGAAVTSAILYG